MPIERGVGKASMLILCRLTSRYHAQIPVAIPPNLDPAVAKQVIEYLKANPEAAQQSYEQAHRMLQTPGMAQTMLEAKVRYFKTYKLALEPPPICGLLQAKKPRFLHGLVHHYLVLLNLTLY